MNREEDIRSKENEIDLLELAKILWSGRKKIVKYGIIGAIAGILIAFSIPKEYETTIKMAPESNKGQQMNGMSSLMGAMAGIDISRAMSSDGVNAAIYPDIVQSKPFLLEFADIPVKFFKKKKGENDPERISLLEYLRSHQKKAWWSYALTAPGKLVGWIVSGGKGKRVPEKMDDIFHLPKEYMAFTKQLNDKIHLKIDNKTKIITASVTMQDPLVSALIADSLVSKLQKYMTAYRTNKIRSDLENSIKQYNETKERYNDAEDKLAEARDHNRNINTETLRFRIERLQNERDLIYEIYRGTAQQVELSKIKLQEQTPIVTIIEPAVIPLKAASPNKPFLIIGFAFLGVICAIGTVVFRHLW